MFKTQFSVMAILFVIFCAVGVASGRGWTQIPSSDGVNINTLAFQNDNIVFDKNDEILSYNFTSSNTILNLSNDDWQITALFYWKNEAVLFAGLQHTYFAFPFMPSSIGYLYWKDDGGFWETYKADFSIPDLGVGGYVRINGFANSKGACFAALSGATGVGVYLFGGCIAKYHTIGVNAGKWTNDHPNISTNTDEMYSIISIAGNYVYSFGATETPTLYKKDYVGANNWIVSSTSDTFFNEIIAFTYDNITSKNLYAVLSNDALVTSTDEGRNFSPPLPFFNSKSKVLDIKIDGSCVWFYAGTQSNGLYLYNLDDKSSRFDLVDTLFKTVTQVNKIEINDEYIAIATNNGVWYKELNAPNTMHISGHIKDNNRIGIEDIIVRLNTNVQTNTDPNGYYQFNGLVAGNYAVTVSDDCYEFEKESIDITLVDTSQDGADFTVTKYNIFNFSGSVMDNDSNPISGIVITSEDNANSTITYSDTTNSAGAFEFKGIGSNNTCNISIEDSCYTFTGNNQITFNCTDITDYVYIATPKTFTISGTIIGYLASYNITFKIEPDVPGASTVFQMNGNYTISGLPCGIFTITPKSDFENFSPISSSIVINGNNKSGINFNVVSEPLEICGKILYNNNNPFLDAVIVELRNYNNIQIKEKTITEGEYCFDVVSGEYSINLSNDCYEFTPNDTMIVVQDENEVGLKHTAVGKLFTVSGTAKTGSGNNLAGETVVIAGKTGTSDSAGFFIIDSIPFGEHEIKAFHSCFCFDTTNGANKINIDCKDKENIIIGFIPGISLTLASDINDNLVNIGDVLQIYCDISYYCNSDSLNIYAEATYDRTEMYLHNTGMNSIPLGNDLQQIVFNITDTLQFEILIGDNDTILFYLNRLVCKDFFDNNIPSDTMTYPIKICTADGKRLIIPKQLPSMISVSPNPSNQLFDVVFNNPESSKIKFEIYNVYSELIYQWKSIDNIKGEYNKKIELSGFPSGQYYCVIKNQSGVASFLLLLIK